MAKSEVLGSFLTEHEELIDDKKYKKQEPYDTRFPFRKGCAAEQKEEAIRTFIESHRNYFDEEKWTEQILAAEDH